MLGLSTYQIGILTLTGVAALFSRSNRRGLLWLAVMAAGYMLSSTYWKIGLPNSELFAGICDAATCVMIYFLGRYLWEMWVALIFLLALAINFIYLASNLLVFQLVDHATYSSILEILNVSMIFTVWGISEFHRIGRTDGRAFHPWASFAGFVRPAHRQGEPGEEG